MRGSDIISFDAVIDFGLWHGCHALGKSLLLLPCWIAGSLVAGRVLVLSLMRGGVVGIIIVSLHFFNLKFST